MDKNNLQSDEGSKERVKTVLSLQKQVISVTGLKASIRATTTNHLLSKMPVVTQS